ncbi:hypothetical protein ACMAUO_01560 [Gluconacetobacter sp. Hr-1-5]|uniref:hypothetical protein n=1 Tax=Gluconacetobacter sp. Hr-1-5 TaxID=3395370 RepID=UPI003B51BB0C
MVLLVLMMPAGPVAVAARPVHRPFDPNIYVAIPSRAVPAAASSTASTPPDGGGERVDVVGKRTVYQAAPVPDQQVRKPAGDDDFGIPLGPLGKFSLGGSPDPDHDPVTGTYLAPFGASYEGSSPLMTR